MKLGLFPGQGVPAAVVRDALDPRNALVGRADDVLGYSLRRRVEIAARRKGARLPTDVAQPAIFVAGLARFFDERQNGDSVDIIAGHSLGEYAALVAADALSFESGLHLVATRGEAMHQAARSVRGGMTALLSLSLDQVHDIARECGVVVANDNAPGQAVVSGDEDGLTCAARRARQAGGRAVLLEVEGPFHSEAMAPAADALRHALDHAELRSPAIPVCSNVTARPYRAPGEIRRQLLAQLTSRVRFRESLEWAWAEGAREARDFGPGEVAAGLARRTFAGLEAEAPVHA
ncbi:MAG: ACP S-malonyltransferase [Actinomycetota bacterium]